MTAEKNMYLRIDHKNHHPDDKDAIKFTHFSSNTAARKKKAM